MALGIRARIDFYELLFILADGAESTPTLEIQALDETQVDLIPRRARLSQASYDAAGRLVSIERRPDGATPGERTLFTLDAAGNRVREEQQRWDGAGWVSEAATDFVYSSRCQLDRVVQAPGTPEAVVTEYRYDCAGNLEQVWDPSHDPATDPPTQVYGYDELDRLTSVSQPCRGVTVTRTVDELDRVTLVDYTDDSLDTSYTYGDQEASPPAFSLGRLTTITRDGAGVAYEYDRYGRRHTAVVRLTSDGEKVEAVEYSADSAVTTRPVASPQPSAPAGLCVAS